MKQAIHIRAEVRLVASSQALVIDLITVEEERIPLKHATCSATFDKEGGELSKSLGIREQENASTREAFSKLKIYKDRLEPQKRGRGDNLRIPSVLSISRLDVSNSTQVYVSGRSTNLVHRSRTLGRHQQTDRRYALRPLLEDLMSISQWFALRPSLEDLKSTSTRYIDGTLLA
ncbi:hypothetical protein B296_00052764 [Ensete ventricosum]|uniref:Uncharacterized protein n=1 Tax=Ensete ventricosum TaxID=4639 RepID=A0A426Y4T5_ENSVE|nr:hypothetical protein B296_00052764 [Ensete ventricosum]